MVPRIARMGHSFKGAGMYYLHDKKAKTKERVMWTETVNLPTQDPDKAFRWMAHTSMNANRLKQQAGVATSGRKNIAGDVYSFSLAWHPKQDPDKETLLQSALETLGLLRLQEHQAVIVAHNDTDHRHVHVVCNLIHPENGKKAVVSYDRLTLSQWAEGVERNDGEILCEQRVINNQKRREQGQDQKMKLVKHREKQLDIAPMINELYQQSDSGKAFQAALEEKGFTLAEGNKRAYTLVDENGKVYSLSRQLEGQRAKDLRERLKDVKGLPMAKELSDERKYFDRDKYEAERQKKIVDAAIKEEQKKKTSNKNTPTNKATHQQKKVYPFPIPNAQDGHLKKLDELRDWEQKSDRKKHRLKEEQKDIYNRDDLLKAIAEIEEQLKSKATLRDSLTGKRQKLTTELEQLKLNLENIEQRIEEQDNKLEKENLKTKPSPTIDISSEGENIPDPKLEAKKAEYERRMKAYRKNREDKNRDRDNDLGR